MTCKPESPEVTFGSADVAQLVETIWSSVLEWDAVPTDEAFERDDGEPFLTGTVSITGDWNGCVQLACHRMVATRAAARLFAQDTERLTEELIRDTLGELTNMLAGNLKGLMRGSCRLGLPSVEVGNSSLENTLGYRPKVRASFQCDSRPFFVEVIERSSHA